MTSIVKDIVHLSPKDILVSCIAIVLIFVGIAIGINQSKDAYETLSGVGGPSINFNRFTTASSSYMTIAPGTANKILATSTSRQYASIYNEGSRTVYLNVNQGSFASTTYGIVLEANDIYEFLPGKNLYDGTVYASFDATTTLFVLEVTTDD